MAQYNSMCEFLALEKYYVIVNLVTTTLGAFLGLGVALLIFWLTQENQRINKYNSQKHKSFQTLMRLNALLKSAVNTTKKQVEIFKAHSEELRKYPYDYHLPQLIVSNDLRRLVVSDNFENFNSYLLFEGTNEQTRKEYKKIFNNVDYLEKYMSDLISQNQKHVDFTYEDSKFIRDNLISISFKMNLLEKDIQFKNPRDYKSKSDYIFLERYIKIYKELLGTGFTNLNPYKERFLQPLQSELFENINNDFTNEIAKHITNTLTRLESISMNTFMHSDNLSEASDKTKSAIMYLQTIIQKIDKINEP